MIKLIFAVFLLVNLTSCYYDSENQLYPSTNCNVKGVYSTEIVPLINSKCIACHSSSNPSGGIDLSSFDKIKNQSTLVLKAIEHNGNSKMPKGEPKLPECDIRKMSKWIENGFPNN